MRLSLYEESVKKNYVRNQQKYHLTYRKRENNYIMCTPKRVDIYILRNM